MRRLSIVGIVVLCAMFVAGAARDARALAVGVPVDVELQLLVDVSGSIDANEFLLQRKGYENAFRSPAVVNEILDTSNGRVGAIAAQFVYWSGVGEQQVMIDWMLIDSEAHATQFANLLSIAARPPFSGMGRTAVGDAISFGTPLFASNGFEGDRQVMDVSGDGKQNDPDGDPTHTDAARDAALASGVDAINGIAIENEESGVLAFYRDHVIGGSGSFAMSAANFVDFQTAIQIKLAREIAGSPQPIPEPGPLLVFAVGALLIGLAIRRSSDAARAPARAVTRPVAKAPRLP